MHAQLLIKPGCTAQHQLPTTYLGEGCMLNSSSWDARPNTNQMYQGRGVHAQTHKPGCTAQHLYNQYLYMCACVVGVSPVKCHE